MATSRPSSSAGPSISQNLGQMGHSMKVPIHPKSGMPSATPIATCAAEPPDMLQLHLAGKCYPCVAYALKPAGCFKGEQCMHCHFCNAKEAKARRRELQQAARRRKRRENALKDLGGEGEGDEDHGQFDVQNASEQHTSGASDPQVSDKPAEQPRQLPESCSHDAMSNVASRSATKFRRLWEAVFLAVRIPWQTCLRSGAL